MDPATSVAADWYTDPLDPTRGRYWDGARWTDHVHPTPPGTAFPTFPAAPPPGAAAAATASQPVTPPTTWTGAPATGTGAGAWNTGGPGAPPQQSWPAAAPYQAYGGPVAATTPAPAKRRTTLIVSGSFSVLIGLLGIAAHVATGTITFFTAIWVLIIARGTFWIIQGMRGA